MADHLKTNIGDAAIRALGALLLVASWAAIRGLLHLARSSPTGCATPLGCLMATLGFLAASAGAAALLLGRHLLDEIEVSSRWRRHAADEGQWPTLRPGEDGGDDAFAR